MALTNFEGTNTIYLSIADGKLVQRQQQPTSSSVERVTKTGKLVHEESFKTLNGVLKKVITHENDYGKQWLLTLEDNGVKYIVAMPYSSRYATSFLKVLPNLILANEIKIMPWSMISKEDATKKITGITVYQEGLKIAPAYTKENQNGLPQMKKIKVKGKEVWDDSDMLHFLEEMVTNLFNEKAPF